MREEYVPCTKRDLSLWLAACVNCGDRLDLVITQHRRLSRPPNPNDYERIWDEIRRQMLQAEHRFVGAR